MLPIPSTWETQKKLYSVFSTVMEGARLLSTAINTMSRFWARTMKPRAKRKRWNGSDFHF